MTLSVDVALRRGQTQIEAAFEAAAGETIGLLGPNGAGKSSVVASIAGLVPPARGRIVLRGRTLDDAEAGVHEVPERRPIGVVFQELLLFPHLSAADNVAFPLRARGVERRRASARALELLERFGLRTRAGARPHELSAGQAQRVALARALAPEPALLLLDEPLSAIDVGARPEIRDLVRTELERFEGVRLVVTHDPTDAWVLADRLVLLEGGRVTQRGTPEEIRDRPRSRYAADLVGVNSFRGPLFQLDDGAGRIDVGEGIVVAWPEGYSGGEVIGILRPADVTVSLEPPAGSARNVLRGPIASVAVDGERARVRIATSPPVVAELTTGSLGRLGLGGGVPVWASFKAVEVRVVPTAQSGSP